MFEGDERFRVVGEMVKIDVGEKDLFVVSLVGVEVYELIHSSSNTVLFCVTMLDSSRVTLRISWSVYKRAAQSRGYRGMDICRGLSYVPDLYTRDFHTIGETYIEVSTREYIEGLPLSEVWCDMDEWSRMSVMFQVENVMEDMSEYTGTHFMKLQGRNLSTSDPVTYYNYKIILSKITRDLEQEECTVMQMGRFELPPVLCHGNLSMDHVIVRSGKIVGIVGWSKCDFIPEVMDRMHYLFARPTAEGEQQWYDHLSSRDLFYEAPPPLYTVSCAMYIYFLRVNSTPTEYHQKLKSKLEVVYKSLYPPTRQSYMGFDPLVEQERRDHGSQGQHDYPQEEHTENPFDEGSIYSERDLQPSYETDSDSQDGSSSEWEEGNTIIGLLDELSVV